MTGTGRVLGMFYCGRMTHAKIKICGFYRSYMDEDFVLVSTAHMLKKKKKRMKISYPNKI